MDHSIDAATFGLLSDRGRAAAEAGKRHMNNLSTWTQWAHRMMFVLIALQAGCTVAAGPRCVPACGAGAACIQGECVADCTQASAVNCGDGTMCDLTSGLCDPNPVLEMGEGTPCGDQVCFGGAECGAELSCTPSPRCESIVCEGDNCWGRRCLSQREQSSCTMPTLEILNDQRFVGGVSIGPVDLEFDNRCNAYVVTSLSGTDYLRRITGEGEFSQWAGVANLNMGEVAVLRPIDGEFGEAGEVALSYTCCATCGCQVFPPQGVARLDETNAVSLPLVVTAEPSQGTGPFADTRLNGGPFGLTWGSDRTLFVGNTRLPGGVVRANVATGEQTVLTRLTARIQAMALYNRETLIVSLETGEVRLVSTLTGMSRSLATTTSPVTSITRDAFSGDLYLSLNNGSVLTLDTTGQQTIVAEGLGQLRLAIGPDGMVYFLRVSHDDPNIPRIDTLTVSP